MSYLGFLIAGLYNMFPNLKPFPLNFFLDGLSISLLFGLKETPTALTCNMFIFLFYLWMRSSLAIIFMVLILTTLSIHSIMFGLCIYF